MIVNLDSFIEAERRSWDALEHILERLARDPWRQLTVAEACDFERLYQRASADLARLSGFAAEAETRRYLEGLVARAYAEIHGARAETRRFRLLAWIRHTFPATFRRHLRAFWLAAGLMFAGAMFGGLALGFDPAAKGVLMPFSHLQEHPAERVAREELRKGDHLRDGKAQFSGMLMTHNTRVSLTAMALGMSWGVGTVILLFYNGVGLGAVVVDYVAAGQTSFLLGWLLPHGAVELPAIVLGGQAGFVLASALIGRGSRQTLRVRLRSVGPDVVTLCFGTALLLVWAGGVEAFLSQYHEPVLPYGAKISFGLVEGLALAWYLARSGRREGGS